MNSFIQRIKNAHYVPGIILALRRHPLAFMRLSLEEKETISQQGQYMAYQTGKTFVENEGKLQVCGMHR